MNYKDEINHLNLRVNSLKYQLKQMNDFKEENLSIKEGLENLREQIEKINEEKSTIQKNINPVFNTFKKLISFNQSKFAGISASYNKDILSRMQKDNDYFANNIDQIEKKTDDLINNLYKKVQKFLSFNSSQNNNNNNNLDINTIKFNLSNISSEFAQIFAEIQKILDLSSRNIAEEEEETIRNIQFIEIVVQEVDRILQFVPFDQLIRNNLLAQLGINEFNYPLNTATIKIILLNMQEIKRKRQTQLKNILNQIKNISSKILQKKSKIENEIRSALNFFQTEKESNNENNNNETLNLEDLFTTAKKINQNNIKEFQHEICGKLSNEIDEFKEKIEEQKKKSEDLKSKAKKEFITEWNKIKSKCCDDVLNHAKNTMNYYFNQRLPKYQKYKEIAEVIQEKIRQPECKMINFGLSNCTETLKKIKQDIIIIKCMIPIGEKNDYLEELHTLLVKETHFIFYGNDNESLSDINSNIKQSITRITNLNDPIVVFILHFNNFGEIEKESYNIEKLIVNCLRTKTAFLFFFGKIPAKDLKSVNKKVKTWLDKSQKIKEALTENNFEFSPDLCYNMETIKDGVEIEMDKITNFKKDTKYKINNEIKNEFEEEYFDKMWEVFNTHSIVSDMESIQNAKDEEICRSRLNSSLIDYSFLCLNLDKKPKERLMKEKDEIIISSRIKRILDEIYANVLSKDFNDFMNEIRDKKVFEMYLNREKLMGEIDLSYNTSLLTEEGDGDKIQKQIGEEIAALIDKYVKKDALKFVGRLVWARVFEKYCPEFYKLIKNEFTIPENFEEYLIEKFNN